MSDVPPESAAENAESKTDPTLGERLGFLLSLPERAVRGGTGLLGGIARESAALLVPQSFQSSRTYTVMVRQMLDFLVHDVGRVAQAGSASPSAETDNYVARKAVGNFVDMASLATLHVSPLMLLAVISDVAYGSQAYLKELADELKAQGVIHQDSSIDHVGDLLSAVSDASAMTGKMFDTPPLSAEGLKRTVDQAREALGSVDPTQVLPQAEVKRMWESMREIADREHVNLLSVGGAAALHTLQQVGALSRGALSTVKVAGSMFDRHVLEHYSQALAHIKQKGLYQSLSETSQPYIAAVWENFKSNQSTVTQDVISGKLLGSAARAVRRWMGSDADTSQTAAASSSVPASTTPSSAESAVIASNAPPSTSPEPPPANHTA